jgi:hypothetical protein
MKRIIILCVLLTGCATTPAPPTQIAVPIVKPLPSLPERPMLQIEKLRKGDSVKKALNACGQDLNMLLQREERIKEFLKEYQKP